MSETTADHNQVRELFDAVAGLAPDERTAYLDHVCTNESLRKRVDQLIAAMEQKGDVVKKVLGQFQLVRPGDGADPYMGKTIGAFRILKPLGHGGMGRVYLAVREEPFKQYVALKLVRPDLQSAEVRQRFEMERQILASLSHPNIARLIDGGATEEGLAYLAMEYVEGQPINRYCDAQCLSVQQRLRLFQEVCKAVHFAHQNLVVHRDLKPSNIYVKEDPDGTPRVKLLDFGIAKLLNPHLNTADVPVTRGNQRLMTPEYAAPEQVRHEPVTTATDIYALGVILYELLTGHRPYQFSSTSPVEIERVLCEKIPDRPSTKVLHYAERTLTNGGVEVVGKDELGRRRSVSPDRLRSLLRGDLDNVVMMALRKEPQRRYGSAEKFAEDIERYLGQQPVQARQSTMGYRMQKFVSRHRWGVGATLLFVGLTIAYGVTTTLQARRVAAERDRAETALAQSQALTSFLTGLFTASDPSEARGDELTALELLERGSERAIELDEEPEVQYALYDALGGVYFSMGLYDEALHKHTLAADVLLAHEPVKKEFLSVTLNNLGNVESSRGNTEVAFQYFGESMALKQALYGSDHPSIASGLRNMASLYRRTGDYEQAVVHFNEALSIYRRLGDAYEEEEAHVLNGLAVVYRRQSRFDEAEQMHREALAMRRRLLGDDHPNVATSLNNLALLLHNMGRIDEAEPMAREALALRLRVLGPNHPHVATTQDNLAGMLRDDGRTDEAIDLYEASLAIRLASLGEGHPELASQYNNMGSIYTDLEQFTLAETYFNKSLGILRSTYGNDHPYIPAALNNLAGVLMELERYQETEVALEEAYRIRATRHGVDHPNVARINGRWGVLLTRMGQFNAAKERLMAAHTVFEQALGSEHRLTQGAALRLHELYTAWGDLEKAEAWKSYLKNGDSRGG